MLAADRRGIPDGEIAARRRQAILDELELVVGADRYIRRQLDLSRHLGNGQYIFLGLRRRVGGQAAQVVRALCSGNGVAGEEQAFAPDQRMLAQAHDARHVGQVELLIDECVEKFGVAAHPQLRIG